MVVKTSSLSRSSSSRSNPAVELQFEKSPNSQSGSLDGRRVSSGASVDWNVDLTEQLSLLEVSDNSSTSILTSSLASALETIIERNESYNDCSLPSTSSTIQRPTIFHGLRPPPITIECYLERIAKYTKCSPVCFVLALIYIDMVCQKHSDMLPASLNIHRLLITCIMLAAKFMDDFYFNNAFYARVGGISLQELNRCELEILKLLDFRLHVSNDDIKFYLKQLQSGSIALGACDVGVMVGRKRRSASGSRTERRLHQRSSVDSSDAGDGEERPSAGSTECEVVIDDNSDHVRRTSST